MPVRVVTSGGSPVRIVTSGGDPVRIVTHGISDPVRVIGGGLAPDAPTFVSAEVGTVDASTVVVTFSTDITAPCGDCSLGFTVLVNGLADAITACVIVGGNTVQLTLTTAVVFGDVVTISYNSAVGCIMESTGVTDLATFGAQAVTNNTVDWYRAGGAPAPVAAYQPKGAADLAASYVNLVNPGTYDAAPGTAPTFNAATGWTFDAASSQYLTTGIVVPNGTYTSIVRFSNVSNIGRSFGVEQSVGANAKLWIIPNFTGNIVFYGYGITTTGHKSKAPGLASGVLGIAGTACYRNGVSDETIVPGAATYPTTHAIFIGGNNHNGAAADFISANILALVFYSSTLTAPQVAAVSAAMAAL